MEGSVEACPPGPGRPDRDPPSIENRPDRTTTMTALIIVVVILAAAALANVAQHFGL
jgi:hypothetical protein